MKFIVHNLRMIWARLSNSGWVLAELFLVFIVMWFLCDSLGCMKYTFYRPLGYDIDHVYRLTTVRGGESRDTTLLDADKYLNILKRLEQEPTVEAPLPALSSWLAVPDTKCPSSPSALSTAKLPASLSGSVSCSTPPARWQSMRYVQW